MRPNVLAVSLVVVVAACGSDDGGGPVDAVVPGIDAMLPGEPGTLDESFGVGGRVIDTSSGQSYAVGATLQADGRLLVLTYLVAGPVLELRRYDEAGVLDPGFGIGGKVTLATGGSYRTLPACVVTRADEVILVGYRDGADGKITALDPDGALLPGFGDAASTQTLTVGELGVGLAQLNLVRTPSGVAWVVATVGLDTRVLRLTAGGAIDPTFGTAGLVTLSNFFTSDARFDAMGRLALGGSRTDRAAAARLTATGALDTDLSTDGFAEVVLLSGTFYDAILPLTDGRFAVEGDFGTTTLQVLDAAGDLDLSFTGDGSFASPLGAYPRLAEVGGDLVLVGGGDGGFELYRLAPADGALVETFDDDGIARVGVDVPLAFVSGALVDARGRLVIVGARATDVVGASEFVLARLWM